MASDATLRCPKAVSRQNPIGPPWRVLVEKTPVTAPFATVTHYKASCTTVEHMVQQNWFTKRAFLTINYNYLT